MSQPRLPAQFGLSLSNPCNCIYLDDSTPSTDVFTLPNHFTGG